MSEEGISIVLPAYKEADNLKLLLPEIISKLTPLALPIEILVLDTMQPMDGTRDVCERYPEYVRYVSRRGGNCYGDAIRTGISEVRWPYVVMMDADGSHSSSDIVRLYETIIQEKQNVVIGSRYVEGGNSCNGPILKMMSGCVNLTFRLIFQVPIHDLSNSFRIYEAELLKSLDLKCNNFDIVEEILLKLLQENKTLKIMEIPICFNKRSSGKSKRALLPFICSYFSLIIRLLALKMKRRK